MNKVRNFCFAVIAILLLIALIMTISVVTKKPQPAIDFTATSYNGTEFKLSDNYQKCGTILTFIDPEVEGSITLLEEIISIKGQADIIAVSVSSSSKEEQIKLLSDNILSLEKLCLESAEIIAEYNIGNAPITYFIDKNGLVQNGFVGNIKQQTIQKYISIITENK